MLPTPSTNRISITSGASVRGIILRPKNLQYNLPNHFKRPMTTHKSEQLAIQVVSNKYNNQRDIYSSALRLALPFDTEILTVPIGQVPVNCSIDPKESPRLRTDRRTAYHFSYLHKHAWEYYLNNYTGSEEDILVVIEDGSLLTVDSSELTSALTLELNRMHTHFLYLGWCLQVHSKVSSCEYAYAIRRSVITKVISMIDTCSATGLTHQLHSLFHHQRLSFSRVSTQQCWPSLVNERLQSVETVDASTERRNIYCGLLRRSSVVFGERLRRRRRRLRHS